MNASDDEKSGELEWRLRVSRRARYAKLQIKPFGGLEVVISPRFPRAQVPGLVARHADWARRQLARQARLRAAVQMPQYLQLAIDNSERPVVYPNAALQTNYDLFDEPTAAAVILTATEQAQQCRELRAWIRDHAHKLLPPMLDAVSLSIGMPYGRLSIRSQKTRWGSCSSRGNISLNDQLLFLPADTVTYLMIHELCHTRHLNHSRDFWRLVEQHCADYRRHEKRLSRSRDLVPDWFLLDIYS